MGSGAMLAGPSGRARPFFDGVVVRRDRCRKPARVDPAACGQASKCVGLCEHRVRPEKAISASLSRHRTAAAMLGNRVVVDHPTAQSGCFSKACSRTSTLRHLLGRTVSPRDVDVNFPGSAHLGMVNRPDRHPSRDGVAVQDGTVAAQIVCHARARPRPPTGRGEYRRPGRAGRRRCSTAATRSVLGTSRRSTNSRRMPARRLCRGSVSLPSVPAVSTPTTAPCRIR